jgi:hypothetical protein
MIHAQSEADYNNVAKQLLDNIKIAKTKPTISKTIIEKVK